VPASVTTAIPGPSVPAASLPAPTISVTTAAVVPTAHVELALSPVVEAVPDSEVQSVQVTRGETLYQISLKNLGTYNDTILEKFQGLNPWLSDPNHIQPGQKIRIPAATVSTDPQRAVEQASSAAPAEAGKQ